MKRIREKRIVVTGNKIEEVQDSIELYATKKIIDIPESRHYEEKSHQLGLYHSDIGFDGNHWFLAPIPYYGSKIWITSFEAGNFISQVDVHMYFSEV